MKTSRWVEAGHETAAEMGTRVLHVSDGVIGHARVLGAEETIEEALHDYASGYTDAPEVKVRWQLFLAGKPGVGGNRTLETPN